MRKTKLGGSLRRLARFPEKVLNYRPSASVLLRVASISEKLGVSVFVGGVLNVMIKGTITFSILSYSIFGSCILFAASLITTEGANKQIAEKKLREKRYSRYHDREAMRRK